MNRTGVQFQLEEFVRGRLRVGGLRHWFTPLLAGTSETAATDEPLLFWMAFLFEDESLDESAHLRNAGRLLRALQDIENNTELLNLAPIIMDQDRLCEIVDRFNAGTISRTGYLSAISKMRYSRTTKDWLLSSDAQALTFFCEALARCQYSKAADMLGLSFP